MTGVPSTERVFALSAFEGVRLIRIYAAKHPAVPVEELLPIIERIESDAPTLDLQASLYLHTFVEDGCPLEGSVFYQACIDAVVAQHEPNWCKAMKNGRMRFLDALEQNDRDVFTAAGLMNEPVPMQVVIWWGRISGYARMIGDVETNERAREAEALTLERERERLKLLGITKEPEWKGLDDNFAGYDVLSYDPGEFGPVNKMIEVKSTIASPLRFIVSRHEWDQALKFGPAYIFHVWDMTKTPPALHERTIDQVLPHIPQDNAKGKWKNAEIPVGHPT